MKHVRSASSGLLLARRRALILAVAAALGASVLVTGAGEGVDRALKSMRSELRAHPASGEVHIVEIDARSLRAISRWPLPRGAHAAAIDRLSQGGARSIAFDVEFSSASDPREDAKLARALKDAGGSVMLPALRQSAGAGSSEYIDSIPIKPLADHAFLAAVNVGADADGYIRQVPLGLAVGGVARPSLAAMLAERNAEIGTFFEVDYAIDPASIPRHSLVDLIAGKVPASQIAGKRFVIGATAVEIGDRYGVPNHGVIPGVVIQALAAETLMAGTVPQRWSGLWALALALLIILWTLRPGPKLVRVGAFAAGMLAILLLPAVTESLFAVTLPLASALAAAVVAALLGFTAFLWGRFRQRTLTDSETGLPNLAALEQALATRASGNIVVARIDRFAAIASGLGPAATATLVLRVADRLRFADAERTIFRTEDSNLAWIEAAGDEVSLEDRIDAIAGIMRNPVDCGRIVDVTLTFGLAVGGECSTKQLVSHAALAALHASQKGSRWARFSREESEETNWHLSLLGELDAAMASGQLWNAYQPKLDLASGAIVGAEALVRWHHPQRGPIQPDSFIPLVEQHGRARDLTAHVLEQALDDALHWERAGYPIGVAVNVSATLLADHEFIEMVAPILRASQVCPGRVTIEVTESAAMSSPERAIAALESWRALGVHISIDDYGTGQSSLGYLQKLPATELKVDKSFVQTIGEDPRNAIMVRSTIAMAHELGMKVVAEGIEDAACLQLLGDMGCDTAQGYFIGRPMSADALSEFLGERPSIAA